MLQLIVETLQRSMLIYGELNRTLLTSFRSVTRSTLRVVVELASVSNANSASQRAIR